VGLEDYLAAFRAGNAEFSTNGMVTTGDVRRLDDSDFLELTDLDMPLFLPNTQP